MMDEPILTPEAAPLFLVLAKTVIRAQQEVELSEQGKMSDLRRQMLSGRFSNTPLTWDWTPPESIKVDS